MKTTFKEFWMVTKKPMKDRPETQNSHTTYRHYSYEAAKQEAERLSVKTNLSFVILHTIERVNPPEPKMEDFL